MYMCRYISSIKSRCFSHCVLMCSTQAAIYCVCRTQTHNEEKSGFETDTVLGENGWYMYGE